MIYNKEECKHLVAIKAWVVVVDRYDENGVPLFAIRQVVGATGSRSGRNSYWGVTLNEPLSDECNAVAYSYVLATADSASGCGAVLNLTRLKQYHPSWMLSKELARELEWRKESAIHALEMTL